MARKRIKNRNEIFIAGKKRNIIINVTSISLIGFVILLILSSYLLIRSDSFVIKYIDVINEKAGCAKELEVKGVSQLMGQNLFFINEDITEKNLKNKFLCIKSLNINKSFPDRVRLQLYGRNPIAILLNLKLSESTSSSIASKFIENSATPSGEINNSIIFQHASSNEGESYIVDDEGMVFSKLESEQSLPKMYSILENISLGQKIKSNPLRNSVKILQKLTILNITPYDAYFDNKVLLINSNIKIIFDPFNNIEGQLASLQLILEKAKIEENITEFVDLRFDKPVVRYAPKKK